jgi:hypothetical protein
LPNQLTPELTPRIPARFWGAPHLSNVIDLG